MLLISDEVLQQVKEEFDKHLKNQIELVTFTKESGECKYCKQMIGICDELASTSDKITVVNYTAESDPDKVQKFGIDKYPAMIVKRSNSSNGRIRFYGIPAGHEFGSLIEDMKMVSSDEPVVSSKAMEIISKIDKPVDIKVFVTRTCPYCPRAVIAAHKFALVNDNIVGEMIISSEFPEDTEKYGISSVPHIIINGDVQFVGARGDDEFAKFVQEAYNHM